MVGLYLLVTLVVQFASSPLLSSGALAPFSCVVELEKLDGMKLGATVIAEGTVVGVVSSVSAAPSENGEADGKTQAVDRLSVQLDIFPIYRTLLKKGCVAVVSSAVTTAHSQPQTIVELLFPATATEPLKSGAHIKGFTSYEQFWTKGFGT